MKAIRVLGRSIRDAFKSVFRNFSLSIASIACIAITLILVALSLVISENVNHFTNKLEEELSIVVYLNEDTTTDRANEIQDTIKSMASYQELTFKSKDEWKLEMQSYSDDLNTTLAYLDTNPLLDSLVVKVKDINELKSTAKAISEIPGVKSAKYGEDTVDQMVIVFRVIEKATTVIKMPFVFEGLFLGIIGSIIPILITLYGYIITYDHFGGYLFSHMIELVTPVNLLPLTSLVLVIIGCVVGMLASWHDVRKYLKI